MTDEDLLSAAGRDPDAFAAFYRRHAPGLLSWAPRRTGDRRGGRDVVALRARVGRSGYDAIRLTGGGERPQPRRRCDDRRR